MISALAVAVALRLPEALPVTDAWDNPPVSVKLPSVMAMLTSLLAIIRASAFILACADPLPVPIEPVKLIALALPLPPRSAMLLFTFRLTLCPLNVALVSTTASADEDGLVLIYATPLVPPFILILLALFTVRPVPVVVRLALIAARALAVV